MVEEDGVVEAGGVEGGVVLSPTPGTNLLHAGPQHLPDEQNCLITYPSETSSRTDLLHSCLPPHQQVCCIPAPSPLLMNRMPPSCPRPLPHEQNCL